MTTIQVDPAHYFRRSYDSKRRWVSYWHQIDELLRMQPRSVLEIGIGNRLVAEYLRARGIAVTTLDIDPRLQPDAVGTVLSIPSRDRSFDVVACFEVLEHLSYESFGSALDEIYRVSDRGAILSVPDRTKACQVYFGLSGVVSVQRLLPIPRLKRPDHKFDGQHYWEIGTGEHPLRRVRADLRASGFRIARSFRVFEEPSHRFFTLTK